MRGANYYVWLVELVDCGGEVVTPECGHVYENDCDMECNGCGFWRETKYVYDDDFDADCNACGVAKNLGDANGNEVVPKKTIILSV